MRRAMALTTELAAESEKKASVVCDHPLGLRDEPAHNIEPLATSSPLSESPSLATTSHPPVTSSLVQVRKGFLEGSLEPDHGQQRVAKNPPLLFKDTMRFTSKRMARMRPRRDSSPQGSLRCCGDVGIFEERVRRRNNAIDTNRDRGTSAEENQVSDRERRGVRGWGSNGRWTSGLCSGSKGQEGYLQGRPGEGTQTGSQAKNEDE